jgi:hypothetical protein
MRARQSGNTRTLTVTHGTNATVMTCVSAGLRGCSLSLPGWSYPRNAFLRPGSARPLMPEAGKGYCCLPAGDHTDLNGRGADHPLGRELPRARQPQPDLIPARWHGKVEPAAIRADLRRRQKLAVAYRPDGEPPAAARDHAIKQGVAGDRALLDRGSTARKHQRKSKRGAQRGTDRIPPLAYQKHRS